MLKIGPLTLSDNEQSILALWACSQTIKDTARCLAMSIRAVNYYRGRLRCKLGACASSEVISHLVLMDEYESLIRFGRKLIIDYQQKRTSLGSRMILNSVLA
jgi:DNA-binding CsgD family transcriptional regulator